MSQDKKISEQFEEAINRHGEVHLDRERTQALLRWLRAQEKFKEEADEQFEILRGLLKRFQPDSDDGTT